MMRKCHNNSFIATIDDNNVVWESAKNEAFCSVNSGASRHVRKGKKAVFYNINGSFNRHAELGAETLPFLLILSSRRFRFVGGLTENSNLWYYRRSSFARILFRNSVRSTNSTCPASISPIRRKISRSQASSTPLSRGASRLWIRSWANSARSDSESDRTSERRRCRGSAVMGSPEVTPLIMLSPIAVPNNGISTERRKAPGRQSRARSVAAPVNPKRYPALLTCSLEGWRTV